MAGRRGARCGVAWGWMETTTFKSHRFAVRPGDIKRAASLTLCEAASEAAAEAEAC